MGLYIRDNKIFITTIAKPFHFHLPKDGDNDLMHKIEYIINHQEYLAEHKIKNKIMQLLSKYKHAQDTHEHRKQ